MSGSHFGPPAALPLSSAHCRRSHSGAKFMAHGHVKDDDHTDDDDDDDNDDDEERTMKNSLPERAERTQ